jgi:DNA-binding protein Alba
LYNVNNVLYEEWWYLLETIYIANKDIDRYISACFYALNNNDSINLKGRGNNIKRTVDIADILLRKYLEVSKEIPSYSDIKTALQNKDTSLANKLLDNLMVCEIKIGSEEFEGRFVSTIDITLRGKRNNG